MEKVYNVMKLIGIANLVLGICIMVFGVATGVVIIVNGAKLLKQKSHIIF